MAMAVVVSASPLHLLLVASTHYNSCGAVSSTYYTAAITLALLPVALVSGKREEGESSAAAETIMPLRK